MAFSTFGSTNVGGGGAAGEKPQIQSGPELQEIQSSQLEFMGFNGETKIKLTPEIWPADALPPPTSSLLSVSRSGLLAAAGPCSVVIAKTDVIREAYKNTEGTSNVKPFQPQLVLPIGTRLSQVAFSSDGSCLALSAETGGGLAVYDVQNILQGKTNSTFEMPTNGTALRALVPNPATETAELFAVVTTKGELLIADMKARQFRGGQSGQILKEGVSCISWSTRGKALLAGLGDGTILQLKADGTVMAVIPRPPNLPSDQFVSALAWLENDLILMAYTPGSSNGGMVEPTNYYILERESKATPPQMRFSKLPEVSAPWGMDRNPAFQFMVRLSKFHNVDHVVFVASTASEDVGLFSKSSAPLAEGAPVNTFTATAQLNDSRRAQLPMKSDLSGSTSPIGLALDLSSTVNVARPIPQDEFDQSPGPLPALLVLNNEGVLSGWWFVYADAIRNGVSYPGMTASQPQQGQLQQSQPAAPAASPSAFGMSAAQKTPAFGQTAFGSPSTPKAPAFGQSSLGLSSQIPSAMGQSSFGASTPKSSPFTQTSLGLAKTPAFGSTSSLGLNKPAFGSASTLGTSGASAFGSPTASAQTSGSAFGAPSQLGSFGPLKGQGASNPSVFGQASRLGGAFGSDPSTASPFTQTRSNDPTSSSSGGFASFAGKKSAFGQPSDISNPFAQSKTSSSPFGTPATGSAPSPFGSGGTFGSGKAFGEASNPFAAAGNNRTDSKPFNPFAATGSNPERPTGSDSSSEKHGDGFKLQSSFAELADKSSATDKPDTGSKSSFFGNAFNDALNTAQKSPVMASTSHEEDMEDEGTPQKAPESPEVTQSTTPKETPAAQKVMGAPPAAGGMFGTKTAIDATPANPTNAFSVPSLSFSQASSSADTAKAEVKIKEEPSDETPEGVDRSLPQPPEARSKDSYIPGSSSVSSVDSISGRAEDAPLPPDFVKPKAKSPAATDDVPPLPPDFTKKSTAGKPLSSASPEPTKPNDAPLPPDFVHSKKKSDTKRDEPPPLPQDNVSTFDDEGSGIDVANELSNEVSPESSFGSKNSTVSNVFTDKGALRPPTRSVFDDVKKPSVSFFSMPPPSKEPESPRSPSPVRQLKPTPITSSGGPSRSVSGPAVGKGAGSAQRKPTMGRMAPPPQKVVQPIPSAGEAAEEKERRAEQARREKQQKEEEQDLSDHEDEFIRAELEAPIEPTKKLAGFVAHQDYTGGVNKEGIPGQIEVVFRDANSMVDTLGLNVRSIKAWIAGQSELVKRDRSPEDLEDPESWTIIETPHLCKMMDEFKRELEAGRVADVQGTLDFCKGLLIELARARKKNDEVARTVETLKEGNDEEGGDELAPLSFAQAEAQQDLRRALMSFRANLAEAEESVALLKAKLASVSKDRKDGQGQKVPTVEAIERTIKKMTAMVEKKSADLDVLMAQLQKYGICERPSSSKGFRRPYSGSPFSSPIQSRPGSSNDYLTPSRGSVTPGRKGPFTPRSSRLGNSLVLANGLSKLALADRDGEGMNDEDVKRYAERLKHRKEVNAILKQTLGSKPVRHRTLDDV